MAAPFHNKRINIRQPDGSVIELIGSGDEFNARFETLDGYTVIKNRLSGQICYANLSPDNTQLVPTTIVVSQAKVKSLSIDKHLRLPPAQAQVYAKQQYERYTRQRRCEIRHQSAKSQQFRLARSAPERETIGVFRGLCLIIDFADESGTISREEVDRFCNLHGYNEFGNNGSVYDYFIDNSLGRLSYTNAVAPYYRAQQNKTYYADESIAYTVRAKELIVEALQYLKDSGFDFSALTNDGENFVYALNVLYAGDTPNFWAEGLWPHASFLDTPFDLGNGMFIHDYQISDMSDSLSLRTFCHENGHMICDYPDLYDYGYESTGVGEYCLMGSGGDDLNPTQICAYLKYKSGWAASVTDLARIQGTFNTTAGTNDFYIYRKNMTEYFLLENRYQTGRDESLPASGLAIWQVDEQGDNNYEYQHPDLHYECTLIQADNLWNLERGNNYGDNSDLFSAENNDAFNVTTLPSAYWWDNSAANLRIHSIGPADQTMIFTIPSPNDPYVQRVFSTNADDIYAVNDTIDITLQFNEPIIVTGIPQLFLTTGMTPTAVQYSSGSGTNTLVFSYMVGVNHASPRLEYVNANALILASGGIHDLSGNPADPVLPTPGSYNSLSNQNDIRINAGSLSVMIDPPSVNAVGNTPVTFKITYQNADIIDLTGNDVEFFMSTDGTASGMATAISGFGNMFRYVTVSSIDGDGLIAIKIKPGTAFNHDGQSALISELSAPFSVSSTQGTRLEFYLYQLKWGQQGRHNGEFNLPIGVTTDSAGNVYVIDQLNNRIQKFNSQGAFITTWGHRGSDRGGFAGPRDLTVDRFGTVFVVDRGNHRVQSFTRDGDFIREWKTPGVDDGKFASPGGIAVDPEDNIFITDRLNNRIQKYNRFGQVLAVWGSEGSGEGEFDLPSDVATDGLGNIYVADRNNHRIQKFDKNQVLIGIWGERGHRDGQFEYPYNLEVDRDNRVYVADHNNNRIQVFEANGYYLTQFGNLGLNDGEFYGPQGVAIGDRDMIYVADTHLNRIQGFLSEGSVSITTNQGWSNSPSITFSIHLWSEVSQLSTGMFVTTNAINPILTGTGKEYSLTLTALHEGPVTCRLPTAMIVVGGKSNHPSNNATVVFDTTPPKISLSSTINMETRDQNIIVTAMNDEPLLNFQPEMMTLVNAMVSAFHQEGDYSYRITIQPLNDGVVSVGIAVAALEDLAGNKNSTVAQLTRVYDITPPTITISQPSLVATRTDPVTYQISIDGAIQSTISPQDVTVFEEGSAGYVAFVLTQHSPQNWSITFDGITGDGTLKFQLAAGIAQDSVGNLSQQSNASPLLIVDNTPPMPPDNLRLAPDDDTGISATDQLTRRTTNLSILGRGEADSTIQISENDLIIASGPANSFATIGIDVMLDEGIHQLKARAIDMAGNGSTFSSILTIQIETMEPLATSFSPANGATQVIKFASLMMTFNEPVYKGTGNISIHLQQNDRVWEEIPVASNHVRVINNQDGSSATVVIKRALYLISREGGYYVNIDAGVFVDKAGNPYGGMLDSITWTLAPVGSDDSDTDLIDDEWELTYFADLLHDPMADDDGDGRSTFVEYWQGTNPLSYEVILARDWNLFSFNVQPTDPDAAGFLDRHNSYGMHYTTPFWKWENNHFKITSMIRPFQGYWIHSPHQVVVEFTPGSTITEIPLDTGWNIIGVSQTITPDQIPHQTGNVWQWKNEQFERVNELKAGVGYWVYVMSPTTLKF